MRLARKLVLTAAMALTAMAMTAGTASAQEESVAVFSEPSGTACSTATGNCDHHVSGSSVLTTHVFGSESQASACNDEFVARLGPNGTGTIPTYTNNAPTFPCTRVNCNGVGELAAEPTWPVTNTGEYTAAGQTLDGHLTVRFCLDLPTAPNDTGVHCTVEIDFDATATHRYRFTAVNEHCPLGIPGVEAELDGTWNTEVTPGSGQEHIEIVHTAPIN